LHIGLVVMDLQASVDFYTKLLGFKVDTQSNHPEFGFKNAFISFEEQRLELMQYTDSRAGIVRGWGIIDHLSFEVDNIDAAIKKLKEAKIDLLWAKRVLEGETLIFFKGPSGERLEMIERTGAKK